MLAKVSFVRPWGLMLVNGLPLKALSMNIKLPDQWQAGGGQRRSWPH